MSQLSLSVLPSAGANPYLRDRVTDSASTMPYVPATRGTHDSIEISNAVPPSDAFPQLELGLQSRETAGLPTANLTALMDAISQYLKQELDRQREADSEFFQRLQKLQEQSQTDSKQAQPAQSATGQNNLNALGDLVASAAPDQKAALLQKLPEFFKKVQNAGGTGDFTLNGIKVGVNTAELKDLKVTLDEAKLTFTPRTPEAQPVTLELKEGKVSVSTGDSKSATPPPKL